MKGKGAREMTAAWRGFELNPRIWVKSRIGPRLVGSSRRVQQTAMSVLPGLRRTRGVKSISPSVGATGLLLKDPNSCISSPTIRTRLCSPPAVHLCPSSTASVVSCFSFTFYAQIFTQVEALFCARCFC